MAAARAAGAVYRTISRTNRARQRQAGRIGLETRQPLARPCQVVGQGGVQRRQVAGAPPAAQTAPSGARAASPGIARFRRPPRPGRAWRTSPGGVIPAACIRARAAPSDRANRSRASGSVSRLSQVRKSVMPGVSRMTRKARPRPSSPAAIHSGQPTPARPSWSRMRASRSDPDTKPKPAAALPKRVRRDTRYSHFKYTFIAPFPSFRATRATLRPGWPLRSRRTGREVAGFDQSLPAQEIAPARGDVHEGAAGRQEERVGRRRHHGPFVTRISQSAAAPPSPSAPWRGAVVSCSGGPEGRRAADTGRTPPAFAGGRLADGTSRSRR